MAAYYNENDPKAAVWLRNLILLGCIAEGDVDERGIEDVTPEDLAPYAQCHFFAGIGGWSHALHLAGWPDDRPVWTGSCPCQPFSQAGESRGFADERHLWPYWLHLIRECRPPILFGEQVASKGGLGWFDLVSSDLEGSGYAVGVADLCAAGVGAPHIRQRLYFVGESDSRGRASRLKAAASVGYGRTAESTSRLWDMADVDGGDASAQWEQRGGQHGLQSQDGGVGELADSSSTGLEVGQQQSARPELPAIERGGEAGELAVAQGEQYNRRGNSRGGRREFADNRVLGQPDGSGREARRVYGRSQDHEKRTRSTTANSSAWSDAEFTPCSDGKARPIEPGTFPLAHGVPGRVGLLRGYGNAIVPQVAQVFIEAYLDAKLLV